MPAAARTASAFGRFLERTSLLRKYLYRYRKLVALGFATLILVDLLEILPPLILKNAVDSVVAGSPYADVLRFAGAYFLVLFAQGFGRWGWRIFLVRSSMLAGRDLRADFVSHLFRMPASFYDKNRVGELMALANGDVESLRQFMGPGILTLADAFFYLATVPVVMFWLSPKLALLALIPVPIIPFIVWKLEGAIHARYKKSQNHFSDLSSMAQENLNGIRIVKAFARESVQHSRFRKLGEDYIRLNLHLARVQSAFGPLMDFVASLGIVLLLYFGGKLVSDSGEVGAVTLGTFVAFQRYIQKMVWPMMALGLAASFYQRALASSERLRKIIDQDTNIVPAARPRVPAGKTEGRIEIRNLSFRFPGEEREVLRNVSLTVEPGMRAAFVGRIGSGKSALFGLIPRIYPAPSGAIFVDGIPVEEWPLETLRAQIGFVSQEVFLFSENVYENIGFGLRREDEEDAERRIERQGTVFGAAALASVHQDVSGLLHGYDTLLGERGVNLSGGQKQRLSLARAIVSDPPILILDDALSAIDVKTEENILQGLRSRARKNTELISAHRISTVREADRIFVLERGELVEQGTHAELIRRPSGIYAQFHEEQRLKEDLESYLSELDRGGAAP
jgi:ATP-binding cassette subfamily B protein